MFYLWLSACTPPPIPQKVVPAVRPLCFVFELKLTRGGLHFCTRSVLLVLPCHWSFILIRCLTITILAQFNDCRCCNNARSLVQKKALLHPVGVCVNFSLLVSGSSLRDLHGRAVTHSHWPFFHSYPHLSSLPCFLHLFLHYACHMGKKIRVLFCVLILFLLLLHLETLELRKDVFFHQMERACMLQEHHGNNTMKDFSWTAMKARIISWDDVPGSIRRKCRWSGIIPRIGFCSARHSQFLFWGRPYRCYDWTTLRKMLGNVLKETMLTIVESYAEMGSFLKEHLWELRASECSVSPLIFSPVYSLGSLRVFVCVGRSFGFWFCFVSA